MSSSVWNNLPETISRPVIAEDAFWSSYEQQALTSTIHVAILAKPYLELILNLDKTIESRFSIYRRLPYERVAIGDIILLKQTSGPIKGIAIVDAVWFYKLEKDSINEIKRRFGKEMQIEDEEFWAKSQRSSYATLIKLTQVRRISPIKFSKKDRNAWAIFPAPSLVR